MKTRKQSYHPCLHEFIRKVDRQQNKLLHSLLDELQAMWKCQLECQNMGSIKYEEKNRMRGLCVLFPNLIDEITSPTSCRYFCDLSEGQII